MKAEDLDPAWFEKMLVSEKYKLLGKLAAGLAHDINNPIMIIQNYISLLIEDVNEAEKLQLDKDSDYIQDFEEIMNQCSELAKITKSLVQFSRHNTKKAHSYDLRTLLFNVLDLMQPVFAKHHILVSKEISEDIPSNLLFPDIIQQVFMNIMDNAIDSLNQKYGKNSSLLGQKKIQIGTKIVQKEQNSLSHPYLELSFYDNGVGIESMHIPNLFQPFFTTKTEKNPSDDIESARGSGMGLAFCKYLIEKNEGFIEVESKVQEFACFNVYLPISSDIHESNQEIVF